METLCKFDEALCVKEIILLLKKVKKAALQPKPLVFLSIPNLKQWKGLEQRLGVQLNVILMMIFSASSAYTW